MNKRLRVTEAQFKAWVAGRDDNETFHYMGGFSYDEVKCPMCKYLTENKPNTSIAVGGWHVRIGETSMNLPKWFRVNIQKAIALGDSYLFSGKTLKKAFGVKKN